MMNKEYVEREIARYKGAKKHSELVETTLIDEDGCMQREVSFQDTYRSVGEPEYVKLYVDCQLVFNRLDLSLSPYIIAISKFMTYANDKSGRCRVHIGKLEREQICRELGVKKAMFYRQLTKLVDTNILIPIIDVDGKRLRGYYFVNPWVVSRGEWKDIKQLRSNFDFVSGKNSTAIVDAEGNTRVLIAEKPDADGQLRLDIGE